MTGAALTTLPRAAALGLALSSAAGVEFFEGSWRDAFSEAERQGKPVFVDVVTDWCGPCKLMDANVFPDAAVGDYFNARFVNVKLDAEDEGAEGPAFAERYAVRAYPTLLFLNAAGEEIGRGVAGLGAEQLVRFAEQTMGRADGEFEALAARYEAGERDREFLRAFLRAGQLEGARLHVDFNAYGVHRERMAPAFDAYFAAGPKEALLNAADFELIAAYKSKTPRGDEAVEFVAANYDAFARAAPRNAVADFALEANYYAVQSLAAAGDAGFRDQLAELAGPLRNAAGYLRRLEPDSPLLADYQERHMTPMYLAAVEDWDGLERFYEARLTAGGAEARTYFGAARTLGGATAPRHRRLALDYARRGHELDGGDAFGALVYAELLAEFGRDEEATAVAEGALSHATSEPIRDMIQAQLAALREAAPSPL